MTAIAATASRRTARAGVRRDRHQVAYPLLVSVIALVAIGILAFIYASLIFPYTGVLLTWLAGVSAGYYSRPHHGTA